MTLKLIASTTNPPIASLIVAEEIRSKNKATIEISWQNNRSSSVQLLDKDGKSVAKSCNEVCRYLARAIDSNLYGGNGAMERTGVDHWLSYAIGPLKSRSPEETLAYLNKALAPNTWLVAKRFTIADAFVSASLVDKYPADCEEKYPNIFRWYKQILSLPAVQEVTISVAKNKTAAPASAENATKKETAKAPRDGGTRKQEGKFIELPGAEMGKVIVRFPPEASGYLHIGHAKAALLNQYYAEAFQGQLIMRFDDTNPAKETVEFEDAILHDLELLQIKADRYTHSSDYFEMMLGYCEQLIRDGKAYVDDTPALAMKEQRDQRVASANRDNSIEQNLKMWEEMKKGTARGQECCVRAKIDYQSANGCMRDPTIYRCKPEAHPRTGTKYKVYPTYDFACPIVDAVEGVTHTLRTTEYHDRDDQFFWFVEALGLRRPHIWEYSRLNMTNTVLSKRKLTWFVTEGLVDGWDDPRFPTVRGILRRGMTVEGLKQFIIAQGSSRSVVFMEWDKIWSFNKKVIDPIAVRYTALNFEETVPVTVEGAVDACLTVQNHPKDPARGTKQVRVGPRVLIERVDAEALVEGQNATFINWGNLLITKIKKGNDGAITEVEARLNLDNKVFKNTLKLTWLAVDDEAREKDAIKTGAIPCYGVYFKHIISKAVLGKDEDFKEFINRDTRREVRLLGESELRRVKSGEIIQLQRKGFFRCDQPYAPPSIHSSREQPLILFHVPDGHSEPSSIAAAATNSKQEGQKVAGNQSAEDISAKVVAQGDKVRQLKAAKADKAEIDAAVKMLLSLKADYKAIAGVEWKPSAVSSSAPAPAKNVEELSAKVAAQGDKVRQLKSAKADKATIDAAVKALLALKADYKAIAGIEWKPPASNSPPAASNSPSAFTKNAEELSAKVAAQGDKVRQLKSAKADKATIDAAVKELLALKADYKATAGIEWKPPTSNSPPAASNSPSAFTKNAEELSARVAAQGDKVRQLKSAKADKATIDAAVKTLLALKADYKAACDVDWKPPASNSPPAASNSASASGKSAEELSAKVAAQGDKVRQLKSAKADKATIDVEVKTLLALKADYKAVAGKDWKPEAATKQPSASLEGPKCDGSKLSEEITKQGDKVRQLKSAKADKSVVDREVKTLLSLKADYKATTGEDWKPPGSSGASKDAKKTEESSKSKQKKEEKPSKKPEKFAKDEKDVESNKTGTRLGLEAKKSENLSDWYSQVITKGEMIEYYDVSGCYILRPWSFAIWEAIKEFLDKEIKLLGVQNCYFPIFVSGAVLEREKTHIADFAPEVAWVTKSGESDLAEPIAIRPTSETVMYPAYAKWLKSHRDLPLKLNQWNNVVRWEFKHPQPFLRTREFLWQEGHTAFATKAEADEEVMTILQLYAKVYEDFLAVPVVRGRKTEKEKFAGGDYTTTVEAFVSASGRAIQGATSHHLGQNFSKMFDIQVEGADEAGEKTFVYQNSWGMTTRTIGVMIMVHGDDKGLVLPPKVASVQAVIVPCGITASMTAEKKQQLLDECLLLERELNEHAANEDKIRVKGDYRDNYSPGWKFNHWELKGVPLRVELGPKDLQKNQVTLVRRDNSERLTVFRADVRKTVYNLLGEIQSSMFNRAEKELKEHIIRTDNWNEFCAQLDRKNLILSPFCGETSCEDRIKADSVRDDTEEPGAPSMGAKSLCTPFDQPTTPPTLHTLKCIHPSCARQPKFYTLFGRSY